MGTSKIQIPKKIRVEDFESTYKEIIEKIGFAFNPFSDEVYQVLSGGLDSSSINRQISQVTVKTNGTGGIIGDIQIKTTVNGRIRGVVVISANNAVNPTVYPTSAPFVNFTTNGQQLTILSIVGLPINSEFNLVLELIV